MDGLQSWRGGAEALLYQSMMLLRAARMWVCVCACALLLACPGKPPKNGGSANAGASKKSKGAASSGAKKTGASGATTSKNSGAEPKDDGIGPLVSPAGIACAQPTCLYHAGAGAYHACLTAGAGTCFHYGPTCTPASTSGTVCMFDAKSARYRGCKQVVEGRCASYGATCEPEGKCYFNPSDLRHHGCTKSAGGICTSYGALCEPR